MTESVNWPDKSPLENLDYGIDWGSRLEAGEVVAQSVWEAAAGITTGTIGVSAGRISVIWLSGGTAGTTYRISNRITTSANRIMEAAAYISVRTP